MKTKSVDELAALRLENIRLQAQVQQYLAHITALEAQKEVARLQALYDETKKEMETEAGTEGWELDLDHRQWLLRSHEDEITLNGGGHQ